MIYDMVIMIFRKVMRRIAYKGRKTEGQHCLAGEAACHYRTFPMSKLLSS